MRENRPYGSEGGEGQTLPDPYRSERLEEPVPAKAVNGNKHTESVKQTRRHPEVRATEGREPRRMEASAEPASILRGSPGQARGRTSG